MGKGSMKGDLTPPTKGRDRFPCLSDDMERRGPATWVARDL